MTTKLDNFDIKILATLQQNSNITKSALAEKIGLSVSPCWERVKRLENAGIIANYQANINTENLIQHTNFYIHIILQNHDKNAWETFETAIADIPEITECYAIGGNVNYILKVVVTSIEEHQKLFDNLLKQNIGIDRYNSHLITRCIKKTNGIDIAHLLAKK